MRLKRQKRLADEALRPFDFFTAVYRSDAQYFIQYLERLQEIFKFERIAISDDFAAEKILLDCISQYTLSDTQLSIVGPLVHKGLYRQMHQSCRKFYLGLVPAGDWCRYHILQYMIDLSMMDIGDSKLTKSKLTGVLVGLLNYFPMNDSLTKTEYLAFLNAVLSFLWYYVEKLNGA